MPLDKFVLMLVAVIAAAGATVWVAMTIFATFAAPPSGWLALIPIALVAYIAWRVISDRIRNAEDDRYDRIER